MLSIDRADFIHNFKINNQLNSSAIPYKDTAQPIGFNTTISAPHIHSMTLEKL
jgi:protein-L-isoaspartate O-methyltransferase